MAEMLKENPLRKSCWALETLDAGHPCVKTLCLCAAMTKLSNSLVSHTMSRMMGAVTCIL